MVKKSTAREEAAALILDDHEQASVILALRLQQQKLEIWARALAVGANCFCLALVAFVVGRSLLALPAFPGDLTLLPHQADFPEMQRSRERLLIGDAQSANIDRRSQLRFRQYPLALLLARFTKRSNSSPVPWSDSAQATHSFCSNSRAPRGSLPATQRNPCAAQHSAPLSSRSHSGSRRSSAQSRVSFSRARRDSSRFFSSGCETPRALNVRPPPPIKPLRRTTPQASTNNSLTRRIARASDDVVARRGRAALVRAHDARRWRHAESSPGLRRARGSPLFPQVRIRKVLNANAQPRCALLINITYTIPGATVARGLSR